MLAASTATCKATKEHSTKQQQQQQQRLVSILYLAGREHELR
jgi:hypothetical protein